MHLGWQGIGGVEAGKLSKQLEQGEWQQGMGMLAMHKSEPFFAKQRATSHLPQLHVVQLGVGVDVGVGHAHQLAAGAAAGAAAVCKGWLQGFQHRDQRHIVLQKLAMMVVNFAYQSGQWCKGGSSASSTAISATLSCKRRGGEWVEL